MALAGEHHPQVLHRRAHAAVVEVDDVEDVVAAQQVAGMAVAVHADRVVRDTGEQLVEPLQQVARHRFVGRQQAGGDEVALQQGFQGFVAEVIHSQGFAMDEGPGGAHRMQAAEQLAEAVELVEVARLRCAAAAAREQGEAEAGVFEQRLAVMQQRRHHRHFAVRQFGGEAVFLADRLVAPAPGAVELGDQRFAFVDAHLVDAVLVAVQREHPRIAAEADAFHRVEDQVWREGGKGMGHGGAPKLWSGRLVYARHAGSGRASECNRPVPAGDSRPGSASRHGRRNTR
ncbi:hypothetical protein D9M69_380210 [compost metagenome]